MKKMKHKIFLIVTVILILLHVDKIILIDWLFFYIGLNLVELFTYFKKRKNHNGSINKKN